MKKAIKSYKTCFTFRKDKTLIVIGAGSKYQAGKGVHRRVHQVHVVEVPRAADPLPHPHVSPHYRRHRARHGGSDHRLALSNIASGGRKFQFSHQFSAWPCACNGDQLHSCSGAVRNTSFIINWIDMAISIYFILEISVRIFALRPKVCV